MTINFSHSLLIANKKEKVTWEVLKKKDERMNNWQAFGIIEAPVFLEYSRII